MKDVEATIQSIIAKVYQQAGGAGGMPGACLGKFEKACSVLSLLRKRRR